MSWRAPETSHKPRELRRRVILPARMRTASGWSDACILNISSRGLLVHARRPASEGSTIELRHKDHVILARVVWSNGVWVGLRSDDRLPIEDIITLSQAPGLQLTAERRANEERRKRPRTHEENRLRSRMVEFASIAVIGVSLSSAAFALVAETFASPMAQVRAALDAPNRG